MNIFVRGFSEINDVKMEYKFQITLRQKWNDERLQFKQKLGYNSQGMKLFVGDIWMRYPSFYSDKIRYLTLIDASKVWMPDTFFRNEKIGSFHNILAPNMYVRIFPNGDVLYSIR